MGRGLMRKAADRTCDDGMPLLSARLQSGLAASGRALLCAVVAELVDAQR